MRKSTGGEWKGMKRIYIFLILILIVVVFGMAGGEEEISSARTSGGDGEILFMLTNRDAEMPGGMEVLDRLIPVFTEKTGVKVIVESASIGAYYDRLKVMTAAGRSPDVFIPQYVSSREIDAVTPILLFPTVDLTGL